MTPDDPSGAIAAFLLSCFCLAGAASDIRNRRLPNLLCLAAWIAGLGLAVAVDGLTATLSHLGHSVLALLAGMVLFRFGMIGGGDAKYYAALAAWFALERGLLLLSCVALAGAFLVAFMLLLSMLRRQPRKDRRRAMSELPYGVAIAAGAGASWIFAG